MGARVRRRPVPRESVTPATPRRIDPAVYSVYQAARLLRMAPVRLMERIRTTGYVTEPDVDGVAIKAIKLGPDSYRVPGEPLDRLLGRTGHTEQTR